MCPPLHATTKEDAMIMPKERPRPLASLRAAHLGDLHQRVGKPESFNSLSGGGHRGCPLRRRDGVDRPVVKLRHGAVEGLFSGGRVHGSGPKIGRSVDFPHQFHDFGIRVARLQAAFKGDVGELADGCFGIRTMAARPAASRERASFRGRGTRLGRRGSTARQRTASSEADSP